MKTKHIHSIELLQKSRTNNNIVKNDHLKLISGIERYKVVSTQTESLGWITRGRAKQVQWETVIR